MLTISGLSRPASLSQCSFTAPWSGLRQALMVYQVLAKMLLFLAGRFAKRSRQTKSDPLADGRSDRKFCRWFTTKGRGCHQSDPCRGKKSAEDSFRRYTFLWRDTTILRSSGRSSRPGLYNRLQAAPSLSGCQATGHICSIFRLFHRTLLWLPNPVNR